MLWVYRAVVVVALAVIAFGLWAATLPGPLSWLDVTSSILLACALVGWLAARHLT